MTNELKRRGDQSKCPACGWRLDAEAYRCPKCLIYFCYKCRARIAKGDQQYQCADQSCSCYGKLLCGACTVSIPNEVLVTKTTYSEAVGPKIDPRIMSNLLVAGIFVIPPAVLIILASFTELGLVMSAICAVPFALLVLWGACKLEKLNSKSETPRRAIGSHQVKEVRYHVCCMQCKHPVKELS